MTLYGYPVPEMIDPRHGFRRCGVPKGPLQFRDYGFELLNSLNHTSRDHQDISLRKVCKSIPVLSELGKSFSP